MKWLICTSAFMLLLGIALAALAHALCIPRCPALWIPTAIFSGAILTLAAGVVLILTALVIKTFSSNPD